MLTYWVMSHFMSPGLSHHILLLGLTSECFLLLAPRTFWEQGSNRHCPDIWPNILEVAVKVFF